MAINGISFLGQTTAQINRLKNSNAVLADLQRQMTTQKKYDNFSGLGVDSQSVQRYRMDKQRTDSYLANIDTVTTRMDMMSNALTQASDLGRQLISTLTATPLGGEPDMNEIRTIARNSLAFLKQLMNTNLDGRYLFSGSDTQTLPFPDETNVNAAFQTEVADWLSGAQTTAQLLADADAMTATDMGIDPALTAAGNVSIRVDDALELDYTVMANDAGFQDLVRALSFAANLEFPDPATDVPTQADFADVMSDLIQIARRGVEQIDALGAGMGSKYSLASSLSEIHKQDANLFQTLVDDRENVDTTEVIAKIQVLQTQLTASYEVTNIVSQLSLVNFIG